MKSIKLFILFICLIGFTLLGSAYISVDQGGGGKNGFNHMDGLDCTSCHSSWQTGSATVSEYIAMDHPVAIPYFEDYIANYTPTSSNSSGVDINKLTQFINSL